MLSSAPKRSAALGSVSAPNSRGTPNNFYEAPRPHSSLSLSEVAGAFVIPNDSTHTRHIDL